VTGFMLNHSDFFGMDEVRSEKTWTGSIDRKVARAGNPQEMIDSLVRLGAHGQADKPDVAEQEIRVVFRHPGAITTAVVNREEGAVTLTHESRGLRGMLADLHAGKAGSAAWKRMIDATAILLALSAVSGLVMCLATPRRRLLGTILAVLATLIAAGAYRFS
jgi:hypothetical protein